MRYKFHITGSNAHKDFALGVLELIDYHGQVVESQTIEGPLNSVLTKGALMAARPAPITPQERILKAMAEYRAGKVTESEFIAALLAHCTGDLVNARWLAKEAENLMFFMAWGWK